MESFSYLFGNSRSTNTKVVVSSASDLLPRKINKHVTHYVDDKETVSNSKLLKPYRPPPSRPSSRSGMSGVDSYDKRIKTDFSPDQSTEPSQLIKERSNSLRISSDYSEQDIRIESIPKRYSERQMSYRLQNLRRRIHRFDMSNLPYIVNLRKIMLLLCLTTAIVVSPTIFIPLARIQRISKTSTCFLDATVRFTFSSSLTNNGSEFVMFRENDRKMIVLDQEQTTWGPDLTCQFSTYGAVSMAIFSIIIGTMTLQTWPELMSVDKGGALAVMYIFLCTTALIVWTNASLSLFDGIEKTCSNLRLCEDRICNHNSTAPLKPQILTCKNLTMDFRLMPEKPEERAKEWNLYLVMSIVQVATWMLTGLLMFMLVVSLVVFWVIWWYYHHLPTVINKTPTTLSSCKITSQLVSGRKSEDDVPEEKPSVLVTEEIGPKSKVHIATV